MNQDATRVAIVKDYFRKVDSGDPNPFAGFTADAQIYFPKFGIGHGPDAWREFGMGLGATVAAIQHAIDRFSFHVAGDTVVVEGTTQGALQNGATWEGGVTPGGRFCSVFEFTGNAIKRMHIYLDPDYGGEDAARFLWGRGAGRRW